MAASVGPGRVFVGVHYLGDIAASQAVALSVWIGGAVAEYLQQRNISATPSLNSRQLVGSEPTRRRQKRGSSPVGGKTYTAVGRWLLALRISAGQSGG